jgi:anthranilate phosphoribosyltransferase
MGMAEVPSTFSLQAGAVAPDFELPDGKGAVHALEDLVGEAGTVVAFVCNHCPFVVHLAGALGRFADEMAPQGVAMVAINSNDVENYPADAPDKMVEFSEAHGWQFAYLYDETQEVARAYDAACTRIFSSLIGTGACSTRGSLTTRGRTRASPTGRICVRRWRRCWRVGESAAVEAEQWVQYQVEVAEGPAFSYSLFWRRRRKCRYDRRMDAIIHDLEQGRELTSRQIDSAAEMLLAGGIQDEKKARLLEALARKGETAAEIAGFVEAFLDHAVNPGLDPLGCDGPTIDVCGTGGDKLNLFNVSTTSMFLVAAAGAVVVKHGNRGITSKSGGADVLEALGVTIDHGPDGFRRCLETAGVGFMMAPVYHPAFKQVAGVRKMLASKGVRTIFNLVGPLLNPVRPQCQLVGVFARDLCPVFAEILQRLGRESAWVVHGTTGDGRSVDELSLMGSTRICKAGTFEELVDEEVRPRDFGMEHAEVEDLVGGDAATNAKILEALLEGEEKGPKREMVLLNAGAAIACAGLADDVGGGIERAREVLDDGAALERLRALQSV